MRVKRLLDAYASDLREMRGRDLVDAIRASEGRVICAEIFAGTPPLVDGVSNAELAAAMGADILLLNGLDTARPAVAGFPGSGDGLLTQVKRWTGRVVGVNLEPVEDPALASAMAGRLATPDGASRAVEAGADLLVVTGNPLTGVTPHAIRRAVEAIRSSVGPSVVLLAGKMHAAGAAGVVAEDDVRAYLGSGADGVLIPVPGTVPGVSVETAARLVGIAHQLGAVVMGTIGTSQEGATAAVIEQFGLMGKMAGVDILHIGDAGLAGVAVPDNIYALSVAVRGRRHTWRRMAASVLR
jgi:Ni,Fe-hydrogenase III small subunit